MANLKLFKVNAIVEIMVVGKDENEAILIASSNFAKESEYVKYRSNMVVKQSDVPSDWLDMIPYSSGAKVNQKCSSLVPIENKPVVHEEVIVPEVVKPEPIKPTVTMPNIISNMPILNFNIPIRKEIR